MRFFLTRCKNRLIRARLRGKAKLHPVIRTNLHALDDLVLSAKAKSFTYVVFDLETTGLDLRNDRILSIGALRVIGGRIRLGDRFYHLVNPERNIPSSSIKIHGIVPDMVAGAPKAYEILNDFLAFLGKDILVAHQAPFDLHYLNDLMWQNHGFPLQNLVLDTLLMCRTIAFPPHPYPYGINLSDGLRSLDAVAHHFGIEIQLRHNALGDALAAAMIFQRILALMEKRGTDTLGKLVKAAGV